MRWLEGDAMWLLDVLRHPEHPDAPSRLAAVGQFFAAFARRSGYDYWDRHDLRPALRQARQAPGMLRSKVRPKG
jgi:hypothetical protein